MYKRFLSLKTAKKLYYTTYMWDNKRVRDRKWSAKKTPGNGTEPKREISDVAPSPKLLHTQQKKHPRRPI
jgi:hypothetical protein